MIKFKVHSSHMPTYAGDKLLELIHQSPKLEGGNQRAILLNELKIKQSRERMELEQSQQRYLKDGIEYKSEDYFHVSPKSNNTWTGLMNRNFTDVVTTTKLLSSSRKLAPIPLSALPMCDHQLSQYLWLNHCQQVVQGQQSLVIPNADHQLTISTNGLSFRDLTE